MTPENQTPPTTPVTETPAATPVVQDPQVAPAPAQTPQYVITQESLNGIKGWLLFFMIVFALVGLGAISIFSQQITSDIDSLSKVILTILTPLMAISFIGTVVLIALRKKAGRLAAYTSLGLAVLYSITTAFVGTNDANAASIVTGIIISVIIYGLWALYFKQSRRVHETLTK